MPRYYARRRRRPQSSRSVGACRRPDALYGRIPRSFKVLGQHLEGGQPNSSVRRRRMSRRDIVLTCLDVSRRVLNRVGCCCLLSHSHAFTDDRRAPDQLTCPPQAHPRETCHAMAAKLRDFGTSLHTCQPRESFLPPAHDASSLARMLPLPDIGPRDALGLARRLRDALASTCRA